MIGSAPSTDATKVLLLGSGELGKELAIECQRLGYYVIACDQYENAPAMQVAHESITLDMRDKKALLELIKQHAPNYVVPEVEAIATESLIELEQEGYNIIPSAQATQLTMDRKGIRLLAAEKLSLPTSPYQFAGSIDEFRNAVKHVGIPCVVKPIMSSSGKGQTIIKSENEIDNAWHCAQDEGRVETEDVIVEGFIDFDYEITLLTVRAIDGIHFCAPIGHRQQDGDYRESWQPQAMSLPALEQAQNVAHSIVTKLGGYGLFGVELFVKGDKVIFNEVSPRPHDTGLVTLVSQRLSEFALHVRAFSKLPIGSIIHTTPAASAVILGKGQSDNLRFSGAELALATPDTQLRLFAKPVISGQRRLGVAISGGDTTKQALERAIQASQLIQIHY